MRSPMAAPFPAAIAQNDGGAVAGAVEPAVLPPLPVLVPVDGRRQVPVAVQDAVPPPLPGAVGKDCGLVCHASVLGDPGASVQ